ncbi:hypothetical protein [Kordiimonas sp.]|uniref:hypothetical protein n=1 Tax=Kordiimonas sp. TaxID=1970157 RepID=UPI003A8E577E
MKHTWNPNDPQRFNPLDDAKSDVIDIAILETIESLRKFVTGETSVKKMTNEDFAAVLVVAVGMVERNE